MASVDEDKSRIKLDGFYGSSSLNGLGLK